MRSADEDAVEVTALPTTHISIPRRYHRSKVSEQKRAGDATKALLALAIGALLATGCGSSPRPAVHARSSRSAIHVVTTTSAAITTRAAREATVSAGQRNEVSAGAGGVLATMHGGTHQPRVGARWPFQIIVTHHGRPAKATVTYEYVFGGQVVARRAQHSFTGRFSDEIEWPSSAVGYPLEFRAAIVCEGVTINLDYPVVVAR